MNKKLILCVFILTAMCFSCVKVTSNSSSLRPSSSVIVTPYTNSRTDDGRFSIWGEDEARFVPRITDLLNLKGTGISQEKLFSGLTKKEILEQFKSVAKDLSDGSTLYWFHFSHGGTWRVEEGEKVAGFASTEEEKEKENILTIDEIMQTVREARGDKPIEKLIVFILACHLSQVMPDITKYKDVVFKKALFFTSSSEETTTIGRFYPSVYSALYFLHRARQNTTESIEELAKHTNDTIQRDFSNGKNSGASAYRFSTEDITKCNSIEFKDDAKKVSTHALSLVGPSIDCSTIKERVIISSRSDPKYEDLYNLTNYLMTNTEHRHSSDQESRHPQYPYLYSHPTTLKNEESIW